MSFSPFKVRIRTPHPAVLASRTPTSPEQHPAEIPPPGKEHDKTSPDKSAPGKKQGENWPPDAIPNPMPGVDPQQTPGIDRLSAG